MRPPLDRFIVRHQGLNSSAVLCYPCIELPLSTILFEGEGELLLNWFISEFNIRAWRFINNFQLEKAPDVTLIYGPRGVGKSAFLHYLYQQREQEQGIIITDALAFARQYAYSAQENKLNLFRQRYRSTQLLLMDDLQFLAGKVKTIEELQYTYEYIIENRGKMVITIETDILGLDFLGERLASRFLSGVVIPIDPPQAHELERFLDDYVHNKRLVIEKIVLSMISERTDNLADALIMIRKFVQFAEFHQDALSLTCFETYWKHEESQNQELVVPLNIIRNVGQIMGISVEELLSSSRKLKVNEAREMAIYIIRTFCHSSFPTIGRYFNRNHNTIIMSYKKMQEKLLKDQELITNYKIILKSFKL